MSKEPWKGVLDVAARTICVELRDDEHKTVESLQVWDPGDRCPHGWSENGTLTVVRVDGDRVEFRTDGSPCVGSAEAMLDPESPYRLIGHETRDTIHPARLSPYHAGWERAWGELWKVYHDDENGEGVGREGYLWQYMGTFCGKHQFKHRNDRRTFETSMISPDDWIAETLSGVERVERENARLGAAMHNAIDELADGSNGPAEMTAAATLAHALTEAT